MFSPKIQSRFVTVDIFLDNLNKNVDESLLQLIYLFIYLLQLIWFYNSLRVFILLLLKIAQLNKRNIFCINSKSILYLFAMQG